MNSAYTPSSAVAGTARMLEAASRSLRTSEASISLKMGVAVASSKDKSINTAFSGPLSSITSALLMREVCRSRGVPWVGLGLLSGQSGRLTYTEPAPKDDRRGGRVLCGQLQCASPDFVGLRRRVLEQCVAPEFGAELIPRRIPGDEPAEGSMGFDQGSRSGGFRQHERGLLRLAPPPDHDDRG